jgi:hypothetical protein
MTLSELNMIRTQATVQMSSKFGLEHTIPRLSGFEAFDLGARHMNALVTIERASEPLIDIFEKIQEAIIAYEGLPKETQTKRLKRYIFTLSPQMPTHKLLISLADDFSTIMEEHAPFLNAIQRSDTEHIDPHEATRELNHMTMEYVKGIKKLFSKRQSDQGDYLRELVQRYSMTDLQGAFQHMRENAKQWGRQSKLTPATDYLGSNGHELMTVQGFDRNRAAREMIRRIEALEEHEDWHSAALAKLRGTNAKGLGIGGLYLYENIKRWRDFHGVTADKG